MTYVAVSDFKFGMDRRRPIEAGVPGTLWVLKNAALTRGGDIERLRKFVPVHQLPAGLTVGLHAIRDQRYVFGAGAAPAGMPLGVRYQQLTPPSASTVVRLLDAKSFDGKIYALAEYNDGNIYHFFDGVRVSDWDALADAAFTYETVAARLAQRVDALTAVNARHFGPDIEIAAVEPGVPFTITSSVTDSGVASTPTLVLTTLQPNVAPVDEVRASATITVTGGLVQPGVCRVTSVVVGGNELVSSPVDWLTDNATTASALAATLNANAVGYRATVAGNVVTILAPIGQGASANGAAVAVTAAGGFTVTVTPFSGGVTKVDPVAQVVRATIGAATPDAPDAWQLTVNGTVFRTTGRGSAMGTSAYVRKRRVYSTAGSLVRYCKLGDPMDWSDPALASGAGFINISNEAEGADALVGMADYNEFTAIFAQDVIVTYSLTADATEAQIAQTIGNTGTFAPRSVVAYGANDVFYVDRTGIRSLRARETYNAAYASDVGSAIDPFVQSIFDEEPEDVLSRATAAIETRDGRYFLALGSKILVLSQFPASRIVGWSYLDFGQRIDALVRSGKSLWLRAGDTIFAYGGVSGNEYPADGEFPVEALTPFISAKDPAGHKTLQGADIAASNTWSVEALLDPRDLTRKVSLGVIDGTTYHRPDYVAPGRAPMFALRFTCDAAGPATLSSTAVHIEKAIQ